MPNLHYCLSVSGISIHAFSVTVSSGGRVLSTKQAVASSEASILQVQLSLLLSQIILLVNFLQIIIVILLSFICPDVEAIQLIQHISVQIVEVNRSLGEVQIVFHLPLARSSSIKNNHYNNHNHIGTNLNATTIRSVFFSLAMKQNTSWSLL